MKKNFTVLILVLLTISLFAQSQKVLNKDLLKEAGNGDLEKVKDLLSKGAEIETKSSFGWTPLMNAAFAKDGKEVFSFLLENGADLKAVNNNNGTILHVAATKGNTFAIEPVLKAGVDINAKNDQGSTALITASYMDRKEFVELLLKNKAEVNIQNNKGYTALIRAASSKKGEPVVELLIKAGADVNIQNEKGESALKVAKTQKIKDLLLQAGAQ